MMTRNHCRTRREKQKSIILSLLLSLFIVPPGFTQGTLAAEASRRTAIVNAVARASPAVVNISATRIVEQRTSFEEWFFGGEMLPYPRWRSLREVGSGIVIGALPSLQGTATVCQINVTKKREVISCTHTKILTNHHVIEDADNIRVAVSDGREFDAYLLGYDYLSDLALLEIDTDSGKNSIGNRARYNVASGTSEETSKDRQRSPNALGHDESPLQQIEWGDSDNLLIGEWAVAIGNPFGLAIGDAQPTVTIGIISATQRTLPVKNRFREDLIQTDASINPGNSGGALVNMHGQLIGINTVIKSTSGGSQGVGFAIPVNKAKKVIQQLTAYGTVIPPDIGMEIQPVTEELAEKLLGNAAETHIGVLVSDIEKRSPAAKAGIQRGDVILTMAAQRIRNEDSFQAVARLLPLNQDISCEFLRKRKKRRTTLRLRTRQFQYTPNGWGLTLEQPDLKMARQYRQPGVIITRVEKESGLANGLKRGDFIYQIGNRKIHSLELFKMIDKQIRVQRRIRLYFERNGEPQTIIVTFNRNSRRR